MRQIGTARDPLKENESLLTRTTIDMEILSQNKKAKGKRKSGTPSKACIALSKINKLYLIEREIKDESPAEKVRLRQERSLPHLNEFKARLEKNQTKVLKGSLTSKGPYYTLKQWEKLRCYCEHG
jgi:hypothetical protein